MATLKDVAKRAGVSPAAALSSEVVISGSGFIFGSSFYPRKRFKQAKISCRRGMHRPMAG